MSDPRYYYSLSGRSFFFSVSFFVATLLLTSLLSTTRWRFFVWPTVIETIRSESKAFIRQIPPQAQFSYSNGRLSATNLELPFTIHATSTLEKKGFANNVLTVTSQEEISDSMMTLSPTTLYVKFGSGQSDSIPYTDLGVANFSTTPSGLENLLERGTQWLSAVTPTFTILFFVTTWIGSIIGGSILNVFFALLTQSMGWFAGLRLPYKQSFQWGLHLYPIALLIDQLSLLLLPTTHFSLVTVTYILMAALIIYYGYRERKKR